MDVEISREHEAEVKLTASYCLGCQRYWYALQRHLITV